MATLVFSTAGTALGGPLGGAIGALAGRQIDATLFGPGARSGPRLRELDVSLSSYGVAIPRIHGRMRVAGSIIWATELQEHSELQGGAKGQPAVNAYSYTANLAIAVSSRPITGIGRIWADGKLLRGLAGDLKVGGTLRVHTGSEEQAVDPLIAASEGEARCPAFRGLAYVVFEALDLTGFGNRIPALTFEVLAGEGVRLRDILGENLPGVAIDDELTGLAGFAMEDSAGSGLALLDPVLPVALDAAGDTIVARVGDHWSESMLLDAPAISVEDDAFGAAAGNSRRRAGAEQAPTTVLRFFDIDRDFQSGMQHATGRAATGQPDVVELPAALDGAMARHLIEAATLRRSRARERLAWRTCTLDSGLAPGSLVRVPDRMGTWRVASWEWREAGVELELARVAPPLALTSPPSPPPTFPAPVDTFPAPTRLVAFELPANEAEGATQRRRVSAAVSGDGPNWSGAALYADRGDGQLHPLRSAPRRPAVVGTTLDALTPASPLLLDRSSLLTVSLAPGIALTSATLRELADGANLALIGDELVQFANARALGDSRWHLSGFVRGCFGTESAAIGSHRPAEPFALLDTRITTLDPEIVGESAGATIVALGRADALPIASPVRLGGIGLRPLAPVHARAIDEPGAGLKLVWTRRARGAWTWRDGVDVPLVEERERYIVTYEANGRTVRDWSVTTPALKIPLDDLAALRASGGGRLMVRQQGTYALSHPLHLTTVD